MNMFSFLKNKNGPTAIFDIGNGSVGVALAAAIDPKTLKPEIFWSHREPIPVSKEKNATHLLAAMVLALEHSAKILIEEGVKRLPPGVEKRVDNAYCVLSAPWIISATKIVKIKEDKPFPVTINLFESVVSQEEKIFIAEDKDLLIQAGSRAERNLFTIEKKVVKARLNGYEARVPFGKKTNRLQLSIYLSATSEAVKKSILRAVGKHLVHVPVSFGTFSLVAFAGIRTAFPESEDFIFIDVSGEMTEVSFVRHRVILESMSFPYGRNAIIRKLARELKTSVELAHSHLTLSLSNKLGKEHFGITEKVLGGATVEWLLFFDRTISEFAKSDFVPTTVFLTTDRDVENLFEKAISGRTLSQFSLEGEGYKVIVLDGERLRSYVNLSVEADADEFLLLESVFLKKLWESENTVVAGELLVV